MLLWELNALLSEQTLSRKILRRVVLLSWAQEVWSSNLHAPTKSLQNVSGPAPDCTRSTAVTFVVTH
jgi:hypothetical protein